MTDVPIAVAIAMNLALGLLLVLHMRRSDLSEPTPSEYATGQVQRRAGRHTSYVGLPRRPRHREPLVARVREQVVRHIRRALDGDASTTTDERHPHA